jgi:alginate O-acetyltransferase complex protein AlgI
MENFNFPFRSKNITEFWRRWHISLSSWFNDYLFTPLMINKRDWGIYGIVFAIVITFAVSGLWHGAAYTFIIFGLLHGVAVSFEFVLRKQRKRISKKLPSFIYNGGSLVLTFSYLCLTWIFFRSSSLSQALLIVKNIFTTDSAGHFLSLKEPSVHGLPPTYLGLALWQFILCLLLIPLLFVCEWLIQFDSVNRFAQFPVFLRWGAYYVLILCILFLGVFDTRQFIYFQF